MVYQNLLEKFPIFEFFRDFDCDCKTQYVLQFAFKLKEDKKKHWETHAICHWDFSVGLTDTLIELSSLCKASIKKKFLIFRSIRQK